MAGRGPLAAELEASRAEERGTAAGAASAAPPRRSTTPWGRSASSHWAGRGATRPTWGGGPSGPQRGRQRLGRLLLLLLPPGDRRGALDPPLPLPLGGALWPSLTTQQCCWAGRTQGRLRGCWDAQAGVQGASAARSSRTGTQTPRTSSGRAGRGARLRLRRQGGGPGGHQRTRQRRRMQMMMGGEARALPRPLLPPRAARPPAATASSLTTTPWLPRGPTTAPLRAACSARRRMPCGRSTRPKKRSGARRPRQRGERGRGGVRTLVV